MLKFTPKEIAHTVRQTRRSMGVTQKGLALTSGTGLRFIIDLEKGKPTCQLGKVLTVLHTLGIQIKLIAPSLPNSGEGSEPAGNSTIQDGRKQRRE
jgi:HTH-type transcriptional regulator / antitoxin HipB